MTLAASVAVSQIVVDAYVLRYSKAQMEAALDQALADRAAGVQVTQINFESGGGAGQMIGGDPNEVIEILTLALRQLLGDVVGPPPLMSSINFGARRSET
ncbi:MAG: hypothetical protein QM680_12155 [Luteolibacter sp.]